MTELRDGMTSLHGIHDLFFFEGKFGMIRHEAKTRKHVKEVACYVYKATCIGVPRACMHLYVHKKSNSEIP